MLECTSKWQTLFAWPPPAQLANIPCLLLPIEAVCQRHECLLITSIVFLSSLLFKLNCCLSYSLAVRLKAGKLPVSVCLRLLETQWQVVALLLYIYKYCTTLYEDDDDDVLQCVCVSLSQCLLANGFT